MNKNLQEFLESCSVIDFETTSVEYRDTEIIEIGVVTYHHPEWQISGELVKPQLEIPAEVSAITHISNRMVENAIGVDTLISDYSQFFENKFLVAHNSFFESKISERIFSIKDRDWICTMRLAKLISNEMDGQFKFNLPYLRYFFDLDVPETLISHRAPGDAFVTAKLLEVIVELLDELGLLDMSDEIGPQLQELSKKPLLIKTMPFGKHKDQPLSLIPDSYWSWAINNVNCLNPELPEYDPDLLYSIEQVLSKK